MTEPVPGQKKVLIVEDDSFLHSLLADKLVHLKDQGIQVYSATSAQEALDNARSAVPDLMLLDIAMPEKSGFELLEELRRDERFKKTPVIFLTNLNQEEDKKRAEELGAVAYFVKANFSLDEVAKEITKTLGITAPTL